MKSAIACALVGTLCFPPFAPVAADVDISHDYGVFLGASPADIEYMKNYDTIVIDAQYFTENQIAQLKEGGHTVFSYLNIGSVENFRSYYSEYEDLTFADYYDFSEERWVDVSEDDWQEFIIDDLAPSILEKGVDGLFVDNVDVYYMAAEEGLYAGDDEDIYYGVENILESLAAMDTYVCINNGDTFVWEYFDRDGDLSDITDAVNQTNVFSSILDYENNVFGRASADDQEYFTEYIEMCADECIDVYLLEYTTDADLIAEIDAYCRDMEFAYYAAPSVDLVAGETTEIVVSEPADETEVTTPVEEPADETVVEEPVEGPATYGAFLGSANDKHHLTAEDIEYMRNYDVIVIDAEYCSEEEIAALKADGHTVWSYLNVGSLETFRSVYDQYSDFTFAPYENWPMERWVNTAETDWQDYIIAKAAEFRAKGVDGFYIDNLDVYWVALNEDGEFTFDFDIDPDAIYNGIVNILTAINDEDTYIMINGGDAFVWEYEEHGDLRDIMDGVNQESVFSTIEDYDNDIFGRQDEEESAYYREYVEMVASHGLGVFLLEYTVDSTIIDEVAAYCQEHGFSYYVSDSIRLKAVTDPLEVNVEVEAEPEVIELEPADDNDEPVEVVVDDSDIAELESDTDENNEPAVVDEPVAEDLSGLKPFGVFNVVTPNDEGYIDPAYIEYMRGYQTIVIDAQYYSADQIAALREGGRTVLSYINLGSLEEFRDYYGTYQRYTLASYANWDDEYWMDVSQQAWQEFLTLNLAPSLIAKGVDGLFVDNVDIYYMAAEEGIGDANAIFNGVTTILSGFQALDTYVVINGGDTYVSRYLETPDASLTDVADAVTQESVFSNIYDYNNDVFGDQDEETTEWYLGYLSNVHRAGLDVYIIEYSTDADLISYIEGYCAEHSYTVYISSQVDLGIPESN